MSAAATVGVRPADPDRSHPLHDDAVHEPADAALRPSQSPPPRSARAAASWPDTSDEPWNDWRWQLSHRLASVAEPERCIELSPTERRALEIEGLFRVDLTPYLVSTIDPGDPQDPIRRQVVPTEPEAWAFVGGQSDSLAEEAHAVVPGLVHRLRP